MPTFPEVSLDITLAQLYQADDHIGDGASSITPILVNAFPCSDYDMTSQLLRNKKYIYQDSELVKPWSEKDHDRLQRILAIKLLAVLGQRYTFAAGDMAVVLFDPDVDEDKTAGTQSLPLEHAKVEALRTVSVFPIHQRPQIRLCNGPASLRLNNDSEALAVAMPLDGLDELRHVIQPEVHYDILSKGCLATSGLPTPHGDLILLDSTVPIQLMACKEPGFFPKGLGAFSTEEINVFNLHISHLAARVAERINARAMPFVVKLQLTTSGGGTYIVRTEVERDVLLQKLSSVFIPLLISSIIDDNAHLAPATIIVTDYVEAVKSYGLTFFIKRSGECRFIGCANQEFDSEGFWTGGLIEYLEQSRLEKVYNDTMCAVGAFLHSKGYFGPVGIDVLEDSEEAQWVVDMNVRTPGSMPLGVLKGHFSDRRGLHFAYILLGIKFPYSRNEFLDHFKNEIEQGAIVVVAWYEELPNQTPCVSWSNLAMAGKSREELNQLIHKVKASGLRSHE